MTTTEAIRNLTNRGWAVFTCGGADGKKPLCKWRDESTTDPDAILPGFNIAVDCGKSGLVVIDLDVKDDRNGLNDWETLKAEHGFADDQALVTETPSGGRHVIFTDPSGGLIGNSSRNLPSGMDVRGSGGYIVAPPSRTPEGSYRWIRNGAQPGPLPPQLVKLLLEQPKPERQPIPTTPARDPSDRKRSYALAGLEAEADALASTAPGGRNDALNTAAFKLGQLVGAGLLRRSEVEAALYNASVTNGLVSDDGPSSVRKTLKSGLDAGELDPREVPEAETRHRGRSKQRSLEESEAKHNEKLECFLLEAGANDEGNAQCVNRVHGKEFLYCEAYGWLTWTGTHWSRDHAEERLDRAIVETLKRRRILAVHAEEEAVVKAARPSAHRVRAAKYLFKSLRLADVSVFDQSPDHLNAKNGVVDLRTGDLEPHNPRQRFTYCLPVAYDPEADTTKWLAFLEDVLNGDRALLDYVQEAIGYSLTGHTFEECLFYLHGPTRAGKGVFTETIMMLLGKKPLATEVDFTTFTSRRYGDTQNFDLAPLKPCRFVAASESSKYESLNTATIKRLTGGNEIYCAFKHQDHFSYRPQFKVWLSSNHPVKADPDDDAAWYRVHVIRFPNCYAGEEDKQLKRRLRKPATLRGVLAWAVAGAIAWYGRGAQGLQPPAQVRQDTEEHRHRLDYVQQWLDECVKETDNEGAFVPNGTLHENYRLWCEDVGRKPKGIASLTQALRDKGYQAGEPKWYNGQTRRGCLGIELR